VLWCPLFYLMSESRRGQLGFLPLREEMNGKSKVIENGIMTTIAVATAGMELVDQLKAATTRAGAVTAIAELSLYSSTPQLG